MRVWARAPCWLAGAVASVHGADMTDPEARPADRKRRDSANLVGSVDGGHGSCPPRGHQRRATGGCARPRPWDDDLTGPRGQPLAWGPYPPGHRSRPGEAGQPPWRGAPMWCVKRRRVARPGPLSVTSILCLVPPSSISFEGRRSRSRTVDLVPSTNEINAWGTRSTHGERDQRMGNEINPTHAESGRRCGDRATCRSGADCESGSARTGAGVSRGRGHPGGHDPWQSPGARSVHVADMTGPEAQLADRKRCNSANLAGGVDGGRG